MLPELDPTTKCFPREEYTPLYNSELAAADQIARLLQQEYSRSNGYGAELSERMAEIGARG